MAAPYNGNATTTMSKEEVDLPSVESEESSFDISRKRSSSKDLAKTTVTSGNDPLNQLATDLKETIQEIEITKKEEEQIVQKIIVLKHEWFAAKVSNIFSPGKCHFCVKPVSITSTEIKCARCCVMAHTSCVRGLTPNEKAICNPPFKRFIHNADSKCTPLIVFVNPKSGGQDGAIIYSKFRAILGKDQVFDVTDGGPMKGLKMYHNVPNLMILVAGGDGSVGWILSEIDKLEWKEEPAVGVLPLGTGNDLARSFMWGGGYNGEDLLSIVQQLQHARKVPMDRWTVKFNNDEKVHVKQLNNYFSIGSDAGIALGFHTKRNESPELFKNRVVNKMWYAWYGGKQALSREVKLNEHIDVMVDESLVTLPDSISGLIILNLCSYAGGTNLWGTKQAKSFYLPSFSDGIMEIVGVKGSAEMGTVTTGIAKPTKIAQAKSVKIIFKASTLSLPVQIDGEPWLENGPCTIELRFHKQSTMLYNTLAR